MTALDDPDSLIQQTSKVDRGPFASLYLPSGEGEKRGGRDRHRMSADNWAMTLNKDSDIHYEIVIGISRRPRRTNWWTTYLLFITSIDIFLKVR